MANPWDEFQRPAAATQASPWDEFQRAPSKPPVSVAGELAAPFSGFNKGVDAALNLPGSVLNAGAQVVNWGAEKLGYEAPLPDEPYKPVRAATRFNPDYEPQTAAGRIRSTIGEAVGSTVVPTTAVALAPKLGLQAGSGIINRIVQNAANAPKATFYNDLVSAAGAGGGVALAREADLGPAGELVAGLAGGVGTPHAVNIAARTVGGIGEGVRHTNRMVQRAINPRQAALDDVADAMIEAKVTPERVRHELVPEPSANLQGRNIGEAEIADMIARSYGGETARDIARSYGIGERTVGSYLTKYGNLSPLPRNIIDVAKDLRGEGGASPLSDAGRTAMAMGGDADAAKLLTDRQYHQPGRVADSILQTRVQGGTFDDEIERLATIGKAEEDRAYGLARQNKQPIDLTPAISTMRKRAVTRQGEIAEQMNKAADLFFEPDMRAASPSPMSTLRLQEAREKLARMQSEGMDAERISRQRRLVRTMEAQQDHSNPLRRVKVGAPIGDIEKFLDARDELGQMIDRSYQDGRPTKLTRELSAFRTRINQAARANNKDLEAADLGFSENRTTERLLADGAALGKTLNQRSRRTIRDFRKITPTQQEVFRVGFERQMADDALRVPRGNAAARQFNNDGFEAIVEELYPKAAGKAVYQRGLALLRNLRHEAISTETINDVMRGSRTAPVQNSIAQQQELARAAANGLTGRFGKIVDDAANALGRHIGKKAAAERLRILTTTEPDQMFPLLVDLAKSAQTAAERQEWVTLIREFRRARLSPSQTTGTVLTALGGDDEKRYGAGR